MIFFDLDDWLYEHTYLSLLDQLHEETSCKVTLFTILQPTNPEHAACSKSPYVPTLHQTACYLADLKTTRPWMEFAVHGYAHTFLECKHWNIQTAHNVLRIAEEMGVFVKGFKAPYWETSPGLYAALLDRGWWIADHDRNDGVRPHDLPVYKIRDNSIHGHVQDIGSNGLKESWDKYVKMRGPFQFISEVMVT